MKPGILIIMIFIGLQSCAVYNHTSVPLNQALNNGPAKQKSSRLDIVEFESIIQRDSLYYGIKKLEANYYSLTALSEADDSKVFLKKPRPSRVWVEFTNGVKYHGILYQLNDSSILVSNSQNRRDYIKTPPLIIGKNQPNETGHTITEFKIQDIKTIKARRVNSIGRGFLSGPPIGLATGAILGAGGFEKIALAAVLSISGAPIGTIIGAQKLKLSVNGDIGQYQMNIGNLTPFVGIGYWKYKDMIIREPSAIETSNLKYFDYRSASTTDKLGYLSTQQKTRGSKPGLLPALILIPSAILLWGGLINAF